MSQKRKLMVTMTVAVDMGFLIDHPCTKDWRSLFGEFDRGNFHFLVGLQDCTLSQMLKGITRFMEDNDAQLTSAADDNKTNGQLVERRRQLGEGLRRYCREQGYL